MPCTSLQAVQNLDNSVPVIRQVFVGYLYLHLRLVFLQAKLGVFLEPPRRDLTFAYSAEDGQWWRVVARIVRSFFGQLGEVVCEHLCADAERLDQEVGQVDANLTNDCGTDHPHDLLQCQYDVKSEAISTYVASFTSRPIVDDDALTLEINDMLCLFLVFHFGVACLLLFR